MHKASLAVLLCHCAVTASAVEPQDVRIPWQPGRTQQFSDSAAQGELGGKLFRPDGPEPRPFVVFLHGCGGLKLDRVKHWGDFFVDRDVGVLMVDSFSTRNVEAACGEGAQWSRRRADDAASALAWLRSQPFVKGDRIAIMGQSQGGTAALVTGNKHSPSSRGIVGVIAMYPACGFATAAKLQFAKPVVIQVGDEDTWTSAAQCEQLKSMQAEGSNVEVTVYSGARHNFDNPGKYRLAMGKYPVGEHAASRDKARERVDRFVASYLR
jgi:dienelactone hydrolase